MRKTTKTSGWEKLQFQGLQSTAQLYSRDIKVATIHNTEIWEHLNKKGNKRTKPFDVED